MHGLIFVQGASIETELCARSLKAAVSSVEGGDKWCIDQELRGDTRAGSQRRVLLNGGFNRRDPRPG